MIGKRVAIGMGIVLATLIATTSVAAGVPGRAEQPGWQKTLSVRSHALNQKITVRIAGGKRTPGPEVTDGGVAGTAFFTASGAITDKGTVTTYRTIKGPMIILDFVAVGRKGAITFVDKIDTTRGTSRWTIASGTKAYKGLHGKGTERENASYTVSTLTGTVWR